LSSILEALKKAEQESIAERGGKSPGPVPLPKRSPYAPRKRRWWLPLGLVGVACIGAVVFWQFRRTGISPPEPAQVAPPASQERTSAPQPTRSAKETIPPAAPREEAPPVTLAAGQTLPQQRDQSPASALQEKAPSPPVSEAQPAVPPAEKGVRPSPSPVVPEEAPPAVAASVPQVTTAPDDSVVAASDEIPRPLQERAVSIPTDRPPAEESSKTYRSDPRIELQALVWAPEASARFVVINNRLLKEGGSTDGITVVQINRDDVLLSEGTDRWHEKFKIR